MPTGGCDSGVSPIEFASSNPKLAADAEVAKGLLTFAELQSRFPGRNGLGILALNGDRSEERRLDLRPMIVMPWFVFGADALIVISTLGGGLLFWFLIKRTTMRGDDAGSRRGESIEAR